MKFIVYFKTPNAIEEATYNRLAYPENEEEDKVVKDSFNGDIFLWQEKTSDILEDFTSQWVCNGELIAVEFDTEAGTATVLRRKAKK
jgi:hypothetical protein